VGHVMAAAAAAALSEKGCSLLDCKHNATDATLTWLIGAPATMADHPLLFSSCVQYHLHALPARTTPGSRLGLCVVCSAVPLSCKQLCVSLP
jgi:hypothetical protein